MRCFSNIMFNFALILHLLVDSITRKLRHTQYVFFERKFACFIFFCLFCSLIVHNA